MPVHQIPTADHRAHGKSSLDWLYLFGKNSVALVLLVIGAWFVLTGLLEIVNFGWRQPMFDQFRMYPNYLLMPFPENALQLENGHRPILPILVSIAEIHWFSASQVLQLAVGGGCAFLMAATLGIAAWRAPNSTVSIRAACVAIGGIGIFWLGNARMLLHGNELLHVYLPGFFLLLGALSVHRAAYGSSVAWMGAATVCCLCATFSFGSGIASFPALAIVAWISRVPLRSIGVLGLGIAAALVTYLWILPGNDGVRGMLEFQPIDSTAAAMRWIASPWINAWLGYAEPPLYPWMSSTASHGWIAQWLSASASAIQSTLQIDIRQTGALLFGLAGFGVATIIVGNHVIRREPQSPIQCLALTLVLFACATSIIIGMGRAHNFEVNPDDVFADRYLPWSCMFWLGLAILLLLKADLTGRWTRATALMVALAIPLGLMPSHRAWAGWGEAVYRIGQQAGAAAISNVVDVRVFPNDDSAATMDVLRTLDLLQQRRLAMFSTAGATMLGETITVGVSALDAAISIDNIEPVTDARGGQPAAHIRGIVTSGIRKISDEGTLVFLDDSDQIAGYALLSFVGDERSALRINIPRKRGFDGYIRNYSPEKQYRLGIMNPDTQVFTYLLPVSSGFN